MLMYFVHIHELLRGIVGNGLFCAHSSLLLRINKRDDSSTVDGCQRFCFCTSASVARSFFWWRFFILDTSGAQKKRHKSELDS